MKFSILIKLFFIFFLFTFNLCKSQELIDLSRANSKYEQLLLIDSKDYETLPILKEVYRSLQPKFDQAIKNAKDFDYSNAGELAYFDFKLFADSDVSNKKREQFEDNQKLQRFISNTLPILAYAYLTPVPKGEKHNYFHNEEIKLLYLKALEYSYSRGLTEQAWLVDHGGTISQRLLKKGFQRQSGDYSGMSLHLGGYIQSVYLMRNTLKEKELLKKYRKVVRNLIINNGVMVGSFYDYADAYIREGLLEKYQESAPFFLNADGIRLFVDYFTPYLLLIENNKEQNKMLEILDQVIKTNIAIKSGTQDTMKPDGVGYHHNNAYVGAYSPFAIEVDAQLLYLFQGSIELPKKSIDAVKLALTSFRQMAQKYNVSNSLSGRLINSNGTTAAVAVNKSMAMLANPSGFNDIEMQGALKEYFDPEYFYSKKNIGSFFEGKRGISIRGLGIFSLIHKSLANDTPAAATPQGAFIKPYANAAFFRGDDWMVTAKGFSQYLWDFEGPVNKRQNSFGQNWSYGLLEIYNAGEIVGALGSGLDIENGFDWYHQPGTTASHYQIQKFGKKAHTQLRKSQGIKTNEVQRNYNSKTFVGGVSLGENGLFAQDLEALPFDKHTDLTARKSYFFVSNKIVAIGSDITGGTSVDETHTTLFQTKLLKPTQPIIINGAKIEKAVYEKSLKTKKQHLQDAVGNSFYLINSSSPLIISKGVQKSLTAKFKPSKGNYVSAYINHGIKPVNQSYEYIVIPNDRDARTLNELSKNIDEFYQLKSNKGVHAVLFPSSNIEAYAFYELVDTPKEMLIKSVNKHATIMTEDHGNQIDVAISVPDFGWPLTGEEVNLQYAVQHFSEAVSKIHEVKLVVRGKWKLDKRKGVSAKVMGDNTIITLLCSDGLTEKFYLHKY